MLSPCEIFIAGDRCAREKVEIHDASKTPQLKLVCSLPVSVGQLRIYGQSNIIVPCLETKLHNSNEQKKIQVKESNLHTIKKPNLLSWQLVYRGMA